MRNRTYSKKARGVIEFLVKSNRQILLAPILESSQINNVNFCKLNFTFEIYHFMYMPQRFE